MYVWWGGEGGSFYNSNYSDYLELRLTKNFYQEEKFKH